jgi:hypothetical protein
MSDAMHPLGAETRDYFWFQPAMPPNITPEWDPALGYQAGLQFDVASGGAAHILLVIDPLGVESSFELQFFPQEKWLELQDNFGRTIPLKVYIHLGRVAGHWIHDQGIPLDNS